LRAQLRNISQMPNTNFRQVPVIFPLRDSPDSLS